ncbi:MAG TPA: hypothetical protein VE974_23430 [Thermoanaerobaculia bacterium]|nr:hypothetical protein [Thermoanaerobaculia bacterium]
MIVFRNLDWAVSRTLHTLTAFVMPVGRNDLAGILVRNTAALDGEAQLDRALQTIREMGLLAGDPVVRGYALHPDAKTLARNSLGPVGCRLSDAAASDYIGALPAGRLEDVHGLGDLAAPVNLFHLRLRLEDPEGAWRVYTHHLSDPALQKFNFCREAVQWLMQLFPAGLSGTAPGLSDRQRVSALWDLAYAFQKMGSVDKAADLWTALAFEEHSDQKRRLLRASLGAALAYLGRLRDADEQFRGLLLASRKASLGTQVLAGHRFADLLATCGRHGDALALLRAVVARSADIDPGEHVVMAHTFHARELAYAGEIEAAAEVVRRAVTLAAAADQVRAAIDARVAEAALMLARGEHESARNELCDVVNLAHEHQHAAAEMRAMIALGRAHRLVNDADRARTILQSAIELTSANSFRVMQSMATLELAETLLAAGDNSSAEVAATQAWNLAICDGAPYVVRDVVERARAILDETGCVRMPLPEHRGHGKLPGIREALSAMFEVEVE